MLGACCAAVATATVRRWRRSNVAQDDDVEAGEKLRLLKAEGPQDGLIGKVAAESNSAGGRQEQSDTPAELSATGAPTQEELDSGAAALRLGKPPVAPLPLDLAPLSRYGNFHMHRTPTRGHDEDGAKSWEKGSPPATVPSTPSPPMWAARRTPPAELVLGPVVEGVEPELTPHERTLSSEVAGDQQTQQGPRESP
eukprot:COSAG02_NODE_15547_length_1161_cov_1.595104_1_plen_196_part_10